MLSVTGLAAGYGGAQALFGVDLAIGDGEAVSLLGRNGMGKTTTVRAIMGLLRPWSGQVSFRGRSFAGTKPTRIARAGLGLVPEGRQIFPRLTVEENLLATAANRHGPPRWTLPGIYALFPLAAGTAPLRRLAAFGRRAADAGGGPCLDDQPAPADTG